MSRTALVTGGTRGIGLAISNGLKAAGYTVAANYGGNEEAAKACEAATGIKCYTSSMFQTLKRWAPALRRLSRSRLDRHCR